MVVSVQRGIAHLRASLGGSPRVNLGSSETDILNQAGEYLVSMHTWKWLEDRSARLDLRGKITVTQATYTQSTKVLTAASGTPFSAYTRVAGDRITIVSGTGVNEGQRFTVASTNGTTTITLEEDLGTAANGQTDISFVLNLDSVALPSDFSELVGYETTEGLTSDLSLVTHARLIELRTGQIDTFTARYFGAISWAQDNTADGGAPTPLLEIWPIPESNDFGAFEILYRAGWRQITDESDTVNLPDWLAPLWFQLIGAFVRGYEEEDQASLSARLEEIVSGPLWAAAVRRDGRVQPDFGPIEGGAVQRLTFPINPFLSSEVLGPS